jgi:carbon monoxide dehydrogenase subunit G
MHLTGPIDGRRHTVAVTLRSAAALWLLLACRGDPADPGAGAVPRALDIVAPATLLRGDSTQLVARVTLTDGRVRDAERPVYRVADSSIIVLSPAGVARARSPGVAQIDVTADGLRATLELSVVPVLASLQVRIESRVLTIGDSLPVSVTGVDSAGATVPTFAKLTVEPVAAATVRGGWLIARAAGLATLVATAGPRVASDTIVAQGESQFDLQLVGQSGGASLPPRLLAIMTRVRTRVQQVVRVAPPGGRVQLQRDACGNIDPIDERIVGLRITVRLRAFDGTLIGLSGPCVMREMPGGLPLYGFVELDSVKIAPLPDHVVEQLLLHEVLHVLGIGGLWKQPAYGGFVQGAPEDADPIFVGPNALRGWKRIPGADVAVTRAIPIETNFLGHWRYPVLANEVMSPRLLATPQPFSAITVGALRDIGWEVQTEAYEDFVLGTPPRTREVSREVLIDSVIRPRFVLLQSGRMARLQIANEQPATSSRSRESRTSSARP